ncbi:MAG: sulfur carrier protein ThiS [Bacteroidales bacterium]|nr:sulfur carrier protein ThiS [Bacteroidales bacterium]
MKVFVNKKPVEVENQTNIEDLLELLKVNPSYCAVAIGSSIVKKAEWQTTELKNYDNITIINATCGG